MSPLSKAIRFSILWFLLAILFNGILWYSLRKNPALANQVALEFFTGYLIEKFLSLDNILVFSAIFRQLNVPVALQGRVLTYGIISAIILRLLMILVGVWFINHFSFALPVFGIFLLIMSWGLFHQKERAHPVPVWITKYLRVTKEYNENRFFVSLKGKIHVTPLFLALILIEISDVIFAVDSIPAIFAVTQNPFIVLTSNIFAILGLRSLYLVLAHTIEKIQFLQKGLTIILIFIGIKLIVSPWIHVPIAFTLGCILAILILTMGLSWKKTDLKNLLLACLVCIPQ